MIISRKNPFGRMHVVMSLFAFLLSFLLYMLIFLVHNNLFKIWEYVDVRLGFLIICGGMYFWTCRRYCNPKKIKKMLYEFEVVPRWIVKTTGCTTPFLLWILACAIAFYLILPSK